MLPRIGENMNRILRKTKIICIDWDSTIINHESLDRLSIIMGKHDKINPLTFNAMNGTIPFDQSLKQRMDILQPSYVDLLRYLDYACVSNITPNFISFYELLRKHDKEVYIIADTFHELIRPYLPHININMNNIYANIMYHNNDGKYLHYDQNNGKCEIIKHLMVKHKTNNVIMIGDGYTDINTRCYDNTIVRYKGIIDRDINIKGDYCISDFEQFIDII
jgi:phosphoserine phosphatase